MLHADELYDTAVANNVNPELVVITAKGEGNFKQAGGSYNYWGLGCPNGSASGYSYGSFAEGVADYGRVIGNSCEGGSKAAAITARYEERVDSGCDPLGYGLPGTLGGMQSVYSWLGNDHLANSSGAGGMYYLYPWGWGGYQYEGENKIIFESKEEFEEKCGSQHGTSGGRRSSTPTTAWEQGQYTAWQVRSKLSYWEDIFGDYGSLDSGTTDKDKTKDSTKDNTKNNTTSNTSKSK